ncbi:hypothetical protein ACPEEZ_09660 [Frigoribacterium sp. 2-23]|uniref:hypothetical protein n=1 Tax=Frigoribacterium sp. 2-23 TaxID=3415006 RepID=UPI003C6FD399
MRFIVAVVVVVVAALMVALGFAQRTVFAPPSSVSSSVTTSGDSTITVVPASALHGHDGRQTISVSGSDTAFAAYGRTSDVLAWVGDASYDSVGYDAATDELTTKAVRGSSDSELPDPSTSDLWYEQYSGAGLTFSLDAPDDVSLIVVSKAGASASAPTTLRVTWPLSTSTPMAGPLIVGGVVVLLIGVLLYLWAIAHHRRTRGPRRRSGEGGKPPRLTRGSRRKALRAGSTASLEAGSGGGRRRRSQTRLVATVPIVLVGALALSGCSADYWPSSFGGTDDGVSASPTPTASATPGESDTDDIQPPAVTVNQVKRIIQRISTTATQADGELNADLAATRFTGPALAQRQANYTIRKADSAAAGPISIPSGDVTLTLPQQADSWPRTVFAVVQDADKTIAPIAMTLVQETARDDYKVEYLMSLEAQATLPTVAPASIGAARLAPDVKLLTLQPNQLATAYGDILRNGDESEYAQYFQGDGDTLRAKIGKPYKDDKRSKLPTTASIDYSSKVGSGDAIAFATNDAGAIVSVDLNEIETVKPTATGAKVNPAGAVKSLSGLTESTKGIEATYDVQLLFSVPPVGSSDKIVLLGFSQALITAKELP